MREMESVTNCLLGFLQPSLSTHALSSGSMPSPASETPLDPLLALAPDPDMDDALALPVAVAAVAIVVGCCCPKIVSFPSTIGSSRSPPPPAPDVGENIHPLFEDAGLNA